MEILTALTKRHFFEKMLLVEKEVVQVYQDRILLTGKEILEKDFKVDTRGYRPQEVDKFLDLVIRDYDTFMSIIKENESEKKELLEDNIRLKQDIRNLKPKLDVLKEGSTREVNNSDLLRRLSNLEKIIYGKDE